MLLYRPVRRRCLFRLSNLLDFGHTCTVLRQILELCSLAHSCQIRVIFSTNKLYLTSILCRKGSQYYTKCVSSFRRFYRISRQNPRKVILSLILSPRGDSRMQALLRKASKQEKQQNFIAFFQFSNTSSFELRR